MIAGRYYDVDQPHGAAVLDTISSRLETNSGHTDQWNGGQLKEKEGGRERRRKRQLKKKRERERDR